MTWPTPNANGPAVFGAAAKPNELIEPKRNTSGGQLQAALAYAAAGWSIVPAATAGKRALVAWRQWQGAAPDPELLAAWFARWPKANLAVVTGRVSGIVVVDVDPRHHGDAALAELEDHHGPLPLEAVVATPAGGQHLYLRHPGRRVGNSNGRIGRGVDVRGDGGLALLPPSRRTDGAYRWLAGGPATVPPIPPGWAPLLHPSPRPRQPVEPPPSDRGRDAARLAGLLRALERAPEGRRNGTLYWCGKRLAELVDQGAPASWRRVLERAGVAVGLEPAEVRDTLNSALGGGDR
jgi:hypothetical protein